MKLGEIQSAPLFVFWGLWERPTAPYRPVHGTVKEKISVLGSGFEKSRFSVAPYRDPQFGPF